MKPITELPSERGVSDRTRLDVQHYTALHTIVSAIDAMHNGTADAFERDLLVQLTNASSTITKAEDAPVRGPLLRAMRRLGLVKRRALR
jgi:hypothetical protein